MNPYIVGCTDAGIEIADFESLDIPMTVAGDFEVNGTKGQFRASTESVLNIQGKATFDGAFWANQGTVLFSGQQSRTVVSSAPTTRLYNLSIIAPEKTVAFDATDPLTIDGTFYVRGTSCGAQPVDIRSTTPGNAWDLVLTGGAPAANVQFAHFRDSNVAAANATNSRDVGGNTGWGIVGCATVVNPAPDSLQVGGVANPRNITSMAPVFDWYNRSPANAIRADAEVFSSPTTNQRALWRLEGNGTDSSGNGNTITATAGNGYTATGRFGQGSTSTAANTGFTGPDLDLPDDFTIDGWIADDLSAPGPDVEIICKSGGSGIINYCLYVDAPSRQIIARLTDGGPSRYSYAIAPVDAGLDGAWHHVAMTFRDGNLVLYIDGEEVASDFDHMAPNVPGQTNDTIRVGSGSMKVDDLRISDVAYPPDAIRGFYRTGRMHAEEIWDFDASDTNGTVLAGGPWPTDSRPAVTYAGAAGTLNADGARYWVRARMCTAAPCTAGTNWSSWGEFDWFDTSQSMSMSLPGGTSTPLGSVLPGTDATIPHTVEVTTTNGHGYSLFVSGPSDTWAMADGIGGATHEVPGRGTPGTPIAWAPGVSGFFGMSVLSATGGKDTTRWGAGIDFSNLNALNWGAPTLSTPMLLHSRTGYDPALQTIVSGIRLNASGAVDPGTYTTTLTFTALPNM